MSPEFWEPQGHISLVIWGPHPHIPRDMGPPSPYTKGYGDWDPKNEGSWRHFTQTPLQEGCQLVCVELACPLGLESKLGSLEKGCCFVSVVSPAIKLLNPLKSQSHHSQSYFHHLICMQFSKPPHFISHGKILYLLIYISYPHFPPPLFFFLL